MRPTVGDAPKGYDAGVMPAVRAADSNGVSTPSASPGPRPDGRPPAVTLRQVLDGLHQGVVLRDAEGMITDVNPAAEEILGRSRAELIGRRTVTDDDGVHLDGTVLPQQQSASSIALAT